MSNDVPEKCERCGDNLWPCIEREYPLALQQTILGLLVTAPWLCKQREIGETNGGDDE